MPYCLEDLILPSTLPTTNIDLDPETMLAALSPVHHHDLSLSSSYRSHSPSLSSYSTDSISQGTDFDIDMAFGGDQRSTQRQILPSSNQSYYAHPQAMPSHQMPYTSHQTSLPDDQSWVSLPLFAQQQSSYHSSLSQNDVYPSFNTALFSSGGGVIPPTPQATDATSFFNTQPSQSQQGYLTTTPSHTNSYSSHESNATSITSSLSRSCSPASLTCTTSASTYPSSTRTTTYTKQLASTSRPSQPAPPSSQSEPPIPQPDSSSNNSLHYYGILVPPTSPSGTQTWRCAYPNCSSRALFTRGCDLRKHFNRHSKHLFCRVKGCPQSAPRPVGPSNRGALGAGGFGAGMAGAVIAGGGGFSSKKDRARHEAKHNPRILCEWVGEDGERCGRRFSRVDNMKDHVRRIHRKGQERQGQAGEEPGRKQEGGDVAGDREESATPAPLRC